MTIGCGVPVDMRGSRLTVAQRADRLAGLVPHIRNDIDVRIARRRPAPGALVRRRVERAEVPREGEQIVVGQPLLAEDQDVVLVPSSLDRLYLGPGHGREIHAFYFGADGSDGNDLVRSGHESFLKLQLRWR